MQTTSRQLTGLMRQGWISLAALIAFGILIEGLSGFRSPALLDDMIRRDMLRLAHAHGTLLNLMLIVAAICARLDLILLGRAAAWELRTAVLVLPLGFLFGGLWHFKDDPGFAIGLVPIGAVLLLVSAIHIALTTRRRIE